MANRNASRSLTFDRQLAIFAPALDGSVNANNSLNDLAICSVTTVQPEELTVTTWNVLQISRFISNDEYFFVLDRC